jgi:hypothetical protein
MLADVFTFGWVLETKITNRTEQLGLQEEIPVVSEGRESVDSNNRA